MSLKGVPQITLAKNNLDPARLDVDLLVNMFEEYGNDYLTPERIRAEPHQSINLNLFVPAEEIDNFAPTGVTKRETYAKYLMPIFTSALG